MAFPNEVLTIVFDELLNHDLGTLSQVSRRFNAVAERLLYSSILIMELCHQASPVPQKTLRYCESLLLRPHLIDATKKLRIRWHSDSRSPPPPHFTIPVVLQLATTLRVLRHLELLELYLGPANFASPLPPLLASSGSQSQPIVANALVHAIELAIQGSSFPRLRYCSLGAEWAKGVQGYTSVLSTFLASCIPSLRHLKLTDLYSPLDLPPHALPRLKSFRGAPGVAASLLPGRPVQYLSLSGQESDVNRNLVRMTFTATPLKYLDLSCVSLRTAVFREISKCLPAIEVLRLKLALMHTLHYAEPGIKMLAGLTPTLRNFHLLRLLDLSPIEVPSNYNVHHRHQPRSHTSGPHSSHLQTQYPTSYSNSRLRGYKPPQSTGHIHHHLNKQGQSHPILLDVATAMEELSLCKDWREVCPRLSRVIFPSQTEWVHFIPSSPPSLLPPSSDGYARNSAITKESGHYDVEEANCDNEMEQDDDDEYWDELDEESDDEEDQEEVFVSIMGMNPLSSAIFPCPSTYGPTNANIRSYSNTVLSAVREPTLPFPLQPPSLCHATHQAYQPFPSSSIPTIPTSNPPFLPSQAVPPPTNSFSPSPASFFSNSYSSASINSVFEAPSTNGKAGRWAPFQSRYSR